MHTMYVDPHCVVDVSRIIAASPHDGDGAQDGQYFITCILVLSRKCAGTSTYVYPTQRARDAAFHALGQCIERCMTDLYRDEEEPERQGDPEI